jgi:hypothetical protein
MTDAERIKELEAEVAGLKRRLADLEMYRPPFLHYPPMPSPQWVPPAPDEGPHRVTCEGRPPLPKIPAPTNELEAVWQCHHG